VVSNDSGPDSRNPQLKNPEQSMLRVLKVVASVGSSDPGGGCRGMGAARVGLLFDPSRTSLPCNVWVRPSLMASRLARPSELSSQESRRKWFFILRGSGDLPEPLLLLGTVRDGVHSTELYFGLLGRLAFGSTGLGLCSTVCSAVRMAFLDAELGATNAPLMSPAQPTRLHPGKSDL
jgi:hypothetical protein